LHKNGLRLLCKLRKGSSQNADKTLKSRKKSITIQTIKRLLNRLNVRKSFKKIQLFQKNSVSAKCYLIWDWRGVCRKDAGLTLPLRHLRNPSKKFFNFFAKTY
jgi:hypothetical protein